MTCCGMSGVPSNLARNRYGYSTVCAVEEVTDVGEIPTDRFNYLSITYKRSETKSKDIQLVYSALYMQHLAALFTWSA
jgi:hypothetical protein